MRPRDKATRAPLFGSYNPEDVTLLLKDITGLITPLDVSARERRIQSGVHYSTMLPLERPPSPEYLAAYHEALRRFAGQTAAAVLAVAEQIRRDKGEAPVLVSLARAGIPVGILIKRRLERLGCGPVAHYALSIIRGMGIDKNAMTHILARHAPKSIQFVDGWTGKGAIQRQLVAAMQDYPDVSPGLAVLSDPAHVAEKYGTREDILIASSCLNATVSGLLSRTVLREDLIGPDDFHGAVCYRELADQDLSRHFLESVEQAVPTSALLPGTDEHGEDHDGLTEVRAICRDFGIQDINLVKPGIGEATRVLLRRAPRLILAHSLHDEARLGHLYQLAREKGVAVVAYPLRNYRACGLIQKLADT